MGRIGKPQKSNKHKKIKSESANRWTDNKGRDYDQPPPKEDEDDRMPHSLREVLRRNQDFDKIRQKKAMWERLQSNPATRTDSKKKKQQFFAREGHVEKGMSKPMKDVPQFVKHRNESNKAFMNRVEKETQAVINKSHFENKYGVDVVTKPDGQVEIVNPKKEAQKARQKIRLKKKKAKKEAVKKAAQPVDRHPNGLKDFSQLQDKVAFGEVAMEPPKLQKLKRAPAKWDPSLLLHARQLGETKKTKNMSLSEQEKINDAREEAIALYRENKEKQLNEKLSL